MKKVFWKYIIPYFKKLISAIKRNEIPTHVMTWTDAENITVV